MVLEIGRAQVGLDFDRCKSNHPPSLLVGQVQLFLRPLPPSPNQLSLLHWSLTPPSLSLWDTIYFFIYSEFCEAKSGPYSDLTRRGSGGGVTMLYFHGHYSSFIVHTYQGGVCEVQGCQQRNKYQYTAFHVY